ncbi:ABC transporter ATP-binding protein [Plantactinospora sp. KBS50]|uniref:ABC transporter ATP-binding protein n=1 Tax=Plantactinospora sp. KBS50 TaxID=2024580 RepID=UPI001E283E7B|nr:ABC transporter ATP-binding protein [Plantactinospora sp. KBS50]
MALGGLLPRGLRVTGGEIVFDGGDLTRCTERQLRAVRGSRIGFVFQDPSGALDPLFPVGRQIAQVVRAHLDVSRAEARRQALRLMDELEIPQAGSRYHAYPHELSGGMKQRVCIAMALAGGPDLLVADEPTTALDVTTEEAILALIRRLRAERGLALLLVTHSLPVAGAMADRLCVMYAGEVVETGVTRECLESPGHPYTEALARAARSLETSRDGYVSGIPGVVPSRVLRADRCLFEARCDYSTAECARQHPPAAPTAAGQAACWHVDRGRVGV